jgi:hypothetical protein
MSIRIAGKAYSQSDKLRIYDKTLLAAGSFDISGIPPSYVNIQGTLYCRSDVVSTADVVRCYVNGDTTLANYRRVEMRYDGVAVGGILADDNRIGVISGASSPANSFAVFSFFILNYAATVGRKGIRATVGERENEAIDIEVLENYVEWENTAAINQLTFETDNDPTDQFITGSRLVLWLER